MCWSRVETRPRLQSWALPRFGPGAARSGLSRDRRHRHLETLPKQSPRRLPRARYEKRQAPRFTLLSFRTFGDYGVQVPLLHELYCEDPLASVTIVTNAKGGKSSAARLASSGGRHGSRRQACGDSCQAAVHPTRGCGRCPRRQPHHNPPPGGVGVWQAENRMGPGLQPLVWGGRILRVAQCASRGLGDRKARAAALAVPRLPEDKHDGEVELELLHLDGPRSGGTVKMESLAAFRSPFACPAAPRPSIPYIYCAAEAGWTGRQLRDDQWKGVIDGLLREFPRHSIVVHGASGALAEFRGNQRGFPTRAKRFAISLREFQQPIW